MENRWMLGERNGSGVERVMCRSGWRDGRDKEREDHFLLDQARQVPQSRIVDSNPRSRFTGCVHSPELLTSLCLFSSSLK